MIWENISIDAIPPKVYLNGFPKAGLHMTELMIRAWLPMFGLRRGNPDGWIGTFDDHAWTNRWVDFDLIGWYWSTQKPGTYLKGHSGWNPDIETLLYGMGIAMVFVYRDLRDVAVSQTHHILNPNFMLAHDAKAMYAKLGGFDNVLSAVIEGLGPYPGVIDRWVHYAPWLDDREWVLPIKYEDMKDDPESTAASIINHCVSRTAKILRRSISLSKPSVEELASKMALASSYTYASPTFRKGQVGGWKESFNNDHVALWKKCDVDNMLEQAGYMW